MKKLIRASNFEKEMTFEEVLMQFDKLIKKEVWRFKNYSGFNFEEFEHLGAIALWKAFKKYDGSTLFLTYATTCIRNEILQELRKDEKYSRERNVIKSIVSIDEISFDDGRREIYFRDMIGSIDKGIELFGDRALLNEIIRSVNEEEIKLIEYVTYGEITQTDLAEKLGCSQSMCSRKVSKMLKKLKKDYYKYVV